ncbi:putative serine--tRNA ligase DIA4 [Aspergillus brunneoviolaceus CBS 621.78]|uniref:Seryl-tRNA synthetase n=1 Tax=Aspergillus brunneoviolaceus CBS 621.78 TaxID=1450534 RepID=A0ACD1FRP5_9EURO|nr:seryl-tRNA synthetase [Aspergillus brunneoviolaceus CBS 621.78]RAH39639.1 seryl-tRNA synthetase [Aspergillus brunneoviolaceus CBS 621.78]
MPPPNPPYICLGCRALTRRTFSSSARRRSQLVRPPTAPKPTPDVKHIRKNPELYAQNCRDRNYAAHAQHPSTIQQLYDEIGEIDVNLRAPRSQIKKLEKAIAEIAAAQAKNPDDATTPTEPSISQLRAEATQLRNESQAQLTRQQTCDEEMQRLALSLPNLSSADTPIGDAPTLISYLNFDPASPLPAWASNPDPTRSHVHIGTTLGLLDFTSSATTTGWGWYFLTNEGALLEQALIQYALTVARRHGWKPVSPPSIVYSHIADACGFQPRDQHNEQQIFTLEQADKDKDNGAKPQRALAGTAEIPLAAMHAGRTFDSADLPLKLVGPSRCYRAEAGSRGVDTKGLYRVHEFTKVEMFAWADAIVADGSSSSDDLFTELLAIQTEILHSLGLPARVLEMPTFDLGASASRKRDIEVLFPSRLRSAAPAEGTVDGTDATASLESAWGEVTSASICTDYQSRRLATRVRDGKAQKNKAPTRFAHTVNGTAMAVPRVLAAILEHGWDPKREVVVVPEVLRGWMGGIEVIGKQK